MALPVAYDTVELRGQYVDLAGNPVDGTLTFTPSIGAMTVASAHVMIVGRPLQVTLDQTTGAFSISLPATNDPDVTPGGFTYQVQESFRGLVGRTYTITIPVEFAGGYIDLSEIAPVGLDGGPQIVTVLIMDGGAPDNTSLGSADGGAP